MLVYVCVGMVAVGSCCCSEPILLCEQPAISHIALKTSRLHGSKFVCSVTCPLEKAVDIRIKHAKEQHRMLGGCSCMVSAKLANVLR